MIPIREKKLFLKLHHHGLSDPGPRPPVDVLDGIAVPVFPRSHELETIAGVRGERDAARLIASTHRQLEGFHRIKARVHEEHVIRLPSRPASDEPERIRGTKRGSR